MPCRSGCPSGVRATFCPCAAASCADDTRARTTRLNRFVISTSQVKDGSEIRFVRLRKRKKVLVEIIEVILSADGLHERIIHLAPALDHVKRHVESIRIFDSDRRLDHP